MLSFVRLLKERYQRVLLYTSPEGGQKPSLIRNLQSLGFAEAVLEKAEMYRAHPDFPIQIAIVGPTQAGKSSAVNWLFQSKVAGVSPLAGFTVHPHGFAFGVPQAGQAAAAGFFPGYRRRKPDELRPDRYDSFTLEEAQPTDACADLAGCVIWDAPDFDSIEAEDYRAAVLRVAALADVIVLVLSKDKYADLSVWEFMRLLEPLGQPTIVCLNKIDPHTGPELEQSLKEKWRASRTDQPPPVVLVPYQDSALGLSGLPERRAELVEEIARARLSVRRQEHATRGNRLLASHWEQWLAPVKAEHRFLAEWGALVEDALRDSLRLYRRNYLDHPQHYETFQRAFAELLTLLEVPGIGGALLAARKAVTWPIRQLGRLAGKRIRDPQISTESAILRQAAEHMLLRMGEALLIRNAEAPDQIRTWLDIAELLRTEKQGLIARFDASAQNYLLGFQPEIDRTARGLFEHLREHPAILNTLRATRVTTDAAALAVALHTGGIGLQDFVIAPAILSVTTLLAEGAIGKYMDKSAAELKDRQLGAVTDLFRNALATPIGRLPEHLDPSSRFAIASDVIREAETVLT